MKKFLPYILIFTVIANIFAPFSVVFDKNKNTPVVQKNEVSAEWGGYINTHEEDGVKFDMKVDSYKDGKVKVIASINWNQVGENSSKEKMGEKIFIHILDVKENKINTHIYAQGFGEDQIIAQSREYTYNYEKFFTRKDNTDSGIFYFPLKHSSEYKIDMGAVQYTGTKQTSKATMPYLSFTTPEQGETGQTQEIGTESSSDDTSILPACGFGYSLLGGTDSTITGCAAQLLYYVLYVPTSWLFGGAGMLFDITFDYSVDSESYKTPFVSEGWKIVRDLSNIFFIFILLYIAFAMILGLENVKAKEMMVNVVIIGLLINFSLFFTKVVIDSSNILARVFYNSEAIKEKTAGNTKATIGGFSLGQKDNDEISLSSGIVSQANPQNIVRHATKIGKLQDQGNTTGEASEASLGAGGFLLVTILAILINLVGIFVFVSVALVFIARVIGLWLAMIFAPFAFLSYIVPALSSIKMVGWKSWWSDLIALSFVAPLFMFMLYLIILFLGGKTFGDLINVNEDGPKFIIKTIMAFGFVMVLLMTAKKLAKEYSGELGKSVTGLVTTGAAFIAGGAIGATAIAGRGTIGRLGSAVSNSDRLKRAEAAGGPVGFAAQKLRNIGKSAGSGSMDVRGIKIAGKSLSDKEFAGSSIGEAKEGGFEKMKEMKIKERVERSKELEGAIAPNNRSEADALEIKLRQEKAAKATQLAEVEKRITSLREKMQDQKNAGMDIEAKITYTQLEKAKLDKDVIKGVDPITKNKIKDGIADLESRLNDENDKINKETIDAMDKYAENIESWGNKTLSYITSFGQHSGKGANIAAEKIRKGVNIE